MKKLFFTFVVALLLAPSAFAASLISNHSTKMSRYEEALLAPLKVTSETLGDIKAEYGIRILLFDPTRDILFHAPAPLIFSGSAVDSGKVTATHAQYLDDYRTLFVPVQQDFEMGDVLEIDGIVLRAYDEEMEDQYLRLDVNGDGLADNLDLNVYEVTDDLDGNNTPPYSVTNVVYQKNEDGTIQFQWDNPPDPDFFETIINRIETKNGVESTTFVYDNFSPEFKDSKVDYRTLDALTYEFITVDTNSNWSDPVFIGIDLSEPALDGPEEEAPEEEAPVEEPTPETPELPETPPPTSPNPTPPATPETCDHPFLDVNVHPQAIYIEDLYCQDVISGRTPTQFEPNEVSTRAEFLKMVMGINGYPEQVMTDTIKDFIFDDLTGEEWHAPYIALARSKGIVVGYQNEEFRPNQGITEAEALKLMLLVAGEQVSESTNDVPWYKNYVNFAEGQGVDLDGFEPNQVLLRADAAEIISKTLMNRKLTWLN